MYSYSEAKSNGWTGIDFKQQIHGSAENWSVWAVPGSCLFPDVLVIVLMSYSRRSLPCKAPWCAGTAASMPSVLLQPHCSFLFPLLFVGCRAQLPPSPGWVSRRGWGLLGSQGCLTCFQLCTGNCSLWLERRELNSILFSKPFSQWWWQVWLNKLEDVRAQRGRKCYLCLFWKMHTTFYNIFMSHWVLLYFLPRNCMMCYSLLKLKIGFLSLALSV